MCKRYDHVSAERALSGAGLVNLYNALCELAGSTGGFFCARSDYRPQYGTEDPRTREATAMFCAMLGTVAGNLALTIGARGGIYIAGGIVPDLHYFAESSFRARFEAKGRFRSYLAAIPTYVITRPLPALLGRPAAGARRCHISHRCARSPLLVAFARSSTDAGLSQ